MPALSCICCICCLCYRCYKSPVCGLFPALTSYRRKTVSELPGPGYLKTCPPIAAMRTRPMLTGSVFTTPVCFGAFQVHGFSRSIYRLTATLTQPMLTGFVFTTPVCFGAFQVHAFHGAGLLWVLFVSVVSGRYLIRIVNTAFVFLTVLLFAVPLIAVLRFAVLRFAVLRFAALLLY